jgi:hypothetical protein
MLRAIVVEWLVFRGRTMARWRAEALKRLPELKEAIESAHEIMAVWIDIRFAFERAYAKEPRDESLISRIYSFADWCENARPNPDAGRDPVTSVVVAFYEDIPTIPAARDDMPRWFSFLEVAENKPVFSHHIGEEGFGQLLQYMQRNRQLYRPRESTGGNA